MFKSALALVLFACSWHQTTELKVNRITAHTPYSSGIIFEYAYKFIREGDIISDDLVEALRSHLMSTGLFTKVMIKLRPTGELNTTDVEIFPEWHPQPQRFVIDKIIFEGFSGIDEGRIREVLKHKGVASNSLLLEHPPQEIRQLLYDTIEEIYQHDSDTCNVLLEQLLHASFNIEPAMPGRYILIIRKNQTV